MKKLNTLLFGAGPGAGFYIKNTQQHREFIGILDNDPAKVGTEVFGLPVLSPGSLNNIDFDEIVITTQWAMAVKSQLIEVFAVDQNKVVLPAKNQLKGELPFYNKSSIALARTIVKDLSALAIAEKVPLVIDFGTLLGVTRDQDIIQWDDDVDFAAPQEYAQAVELLVRTFVAEHLAINWRIERVVDGKQRVTSILLKFSSQTENIVCFTTSIAFRAVVDGKSIHLPSMGMWYAPEHHFNGLSVLAFQGSDVQVPRDHQAYLTFQYGDWSIAKKDIRLTDYANLQDVGFETIKSSQSVLQNI
jgi:hypothetical protein